MRAVVRFSPSLIPLLVLTVAGCAKARPDATPASPAAAPTAAEAPASAPSTAPTTAADTPAVAPRTGTGVDTADRVVRSSRAAAADAAATASSAPPASPAVAQFRAEAAAAFADPSVNALWGVEIQSLDTGEVLFTQNAHALMMPASNMKIVTMSIAATHLGWDYRFETTLSATGPIANGTLNGDLVITGGGDPTISDRGGPATRVFESWADQLRAAGITRITGRIVGDDDRFDDRPIGEGWSWDDMVGQYSVAGGALQFNENIVRLIITPAAAVGQPATIRLDPEGADIIVRSAVTTGPETSAVDINLARERNEMTLYVSGNVPIGAKEIVRSAAVDNPTVYFVNALRATLIRKGIEVSGPAVDIDDIKPGAARGVGGSSGVRGNDVMASAAGADGRDGANSRGVSRRGSSAGGVSSDALSSGGVSSGVMSSGDVSRADANSAATTSAAPAARTATPGTVRAGQGATSSAGAPLTATRRVLITHQSPPLSEIGTTFMKVSQNLFGETLMAVLGERALAAEVTKASASTAAVAGAAAGPVAGAAASAATAASATVAEAAGMPVMHQHVAAARKLYEQTLAGWGVPRGEYVIADGSGLSRYNYLTPHMLVRILRRMARDAKLGPTFEATLPIGGKDGTLGPRMRGSKSENNVRAKTGSLAGVRALSGYLHTADGERMVFSILTNNFNAPTAAIDGITDQVLERLANFTRKP